MRPQWAGQGQECRAAKGRAARDRNRRPLPLGAESRRARQGPASPHSRGYPPLPQFSPQTQPRRTLPNPRARTPAHQLASGALSEVTLCPLSRPGALVLGADRGVVSLLASPALLATQQCLDCGLWTLKKASESVSNPVVAQGRKLRPRRAGLEPSGSLGSQPRTLRVSKKRVAQKCRFAKALPGFTTGLCRRETFTLTHLGRGGGWGTLLKARVSLILALTTTEVKLC